MTKTSMTIAITLLVSAIATIYVGLNRTHVESVVGIEYAKLLFQFLLLIVFGGAVSLLYKQHIRETEERANLRLREQELLDLRRGFVRNIRQTLIGIYNDTKRVRRLLRSSCVNESDQNEQVVLSEPYIKQMEQLLDTQLSLETLVHELKIDQIQLSLDKEISRSVTLMEDYLRSVLQEYEQRYPVAEASRLSELPTLSKFIGPYAESGEFRSNFVHSFQRSNDCLGRAVLTLTTKIQEP